MSIAARNFGLENVDLDILPAGEWGNLQEIFDLPLVSERAESHTRFEGLRSARKHELSNKHRAEVAAILHSMGGDLQRVSRKLGRLSLQEADLIETTYVVGSSHKVMPRSVHLEKREDSVSMIIAGQQSRKINFKIARRLAEYLSVDAATHALVIYLQWRGDCLSELNVADADVREAQRAIDRYRKSDEPTDDPERPYKEDEEKGSNKPPVDGVSTVDAPVEQGGRESPTRRSSSVRSEAPSTRRGRTMFTDSPVVTPKTSSLASRVRTGAAGGTGRSGGPALHPADRKEIESRAIQKAIEYGRDHLDAVEVRDVQTENKGWDLEFVFGDGSWWPVEVKGFGVDASRFVLTKNELEAFEREQDYRLLIVTGVLRGSGQVLCIEHVGDFLDSATRAPMSWAISSWENSVASVTDWREAGVASKE